MKNTKPYFSRAKADEIISLIKEKLKADATKQKSIRAKIRSRGFWASEFGFRNGYTVNDFLSVVKISGSIPVIPDKHTRQKIILSKPDKLLSKSQPARNNSDESYIIDLCDEVLKLKALRQNRFDFLKGDSGIKLPVDAYYPKQNLVIEFGERQHLEEVKFFDRKQTVSGMGRGEQRKLYDQRRRDILPEHGIKLIEIKYSDFEHTRNKKLIRNRRNDLQVLKNILNQFKKNE